ncbi:MAG: hypothetical protein PHH75_05160 [Candidatus Omnitrophica bacterium]|nr:hypothetical protein [Candidatus Omnitrophota bacterium]MDD5574552.1 hypothetical protein [Candidatus Omnitrophota bacterium]
MLHQRNLFFRIIGGIFAAALVWVCGAGAFAEPDSKANAVIRLKDGGVVIGQVLGKESGQYRIMTGSMGIVSVSENDIVSFESKGSAGWEQYERAIVENPQSIASIQGLTQDEEIMQIISDPKVKDAIARQDLEYLKTNEKFLKFMNHPTVKQIIQNTRETVENPEPK